MVNILLHLLTYNLPISLPTYLPTTYNYLPTNCIHDNEVNLGGVTHLHAY
jgi:hypothetical protein